MNPYGADAYFELDNSSARELFSGTSHVWEAVSLIPEFIEDTLKPEILGEVEEGAWLEPNRVAIGKGSRVERGAIIRGPVIIGEDTTIRTGSYIRGHVMIGNNCVIGWGSELRQSIIMNKSNIPHSNQVFTSLIGNRVNLAGKVSTANFRLDEKPIVIRVPVEGEMSPFPTGLTFFGAVVGDDTKIAGNCLIQPGTLIGKRCIVYPHIDISGYVPHDSLVRRKTEPFMIIPRE